MVNMSKSRGKCSKKSVKMKKSLTRIVKYSFNHIIIILLLTFVTSVNCFNFKSDHSVDLDPNYRLMWQVKEQDIIFEIQVRTLGYVGLGFSRDGSLFGADVVIGWVDQGQAYFQVSHSNLFDLNSTFLYKKVSQKLPGKLSHCSHKN